MVGFWFVVHWKTSKDEQLRALMGEQKALAVDLYGELQVSGEFSSTAR
jgi:hypothetical protein